MRVRRIFQIGILVVVAMLAASMRLTSSSMFKAAPVAMKASVPNPSLYGPEPPNPSANIPPVPDFAPSIYYGSTPPCYVHPASQSCDTMALEAINHAHAVEGIPPISLPADYATLPEPIQQFIIVNLERTSRGEPPIVGITAYLDSVALSGATAHTDPEILYATFSYTSNWFGGSGALSADYMYMYEDGWAGSVSATQNLACTSPTAQGCWGHRENILWNPGVPLTFGAAITPWANRYWNSTQVFEETTPSSPSAYIYTWAQYVNSQSPANQCSNSVSTAVGAAPDPTGGGWIVGSDGSIATTGGAPCYGSLAGQSLNAPIVGMASTPDGKGYWLVASDGGVFAFGDATFYGSMGGKPLNKPIVGMASTPDGKGYWLVASDGGIFTFGDATFYGSMGGKPLNQPIVGMAADPATGGYWEVASDGGIFSFDAPFFGSMGGKYLAKPIVGMDALSSGQGYRFVASDGGVFDFGAAGFLGSMGGQNLSASVVGMAAAPDGSGYWLVSQAGNIYTY